MKIAFIGCGNVGAPLADHLAARGHEVVLATSSESGELSDTVKKALARNSKLRAAPPKTAVKEAEVVFLATPYQANAAALAAVAAELADKTLIDCTNPVGPGITHGLKSERSGSEVIQSQVPAAKVVKAFTIYGFENLENPEFPHYGVKPVMMFCGNDAAAKQATARLIEDTGFEPLDVGGLEQALHLEHMTLLWVRHVRVGKNSPHLVWAALRRS
ncbi:MAG: NADPH-dependent F420 reductase [Polyangiaceae bacterium]